MAENSKVETGSTEEKSASNDLQEQAPVPAKAEEQPINPLEKVDEKLVEEAVVFIRDTVAESLYTGSLKIGEYVLENFFGGRIEDVKSKNPHKPASFRALCKRPDLVLHAATLSEMTRVAYQERFFRDHNVNSEALSYSHKAELVKLPNDEKKIELVKKAIEESLSTRLLAGEVKKARGGPEPTETEVAAKKSVKLITNLSKLLKDEAIQQASGNKEALETLPESKRRDLLEKTNAVLEKMKELGKICKDLKSNLQSLEKQDRK